MGVKVTGQFEPAGAFSIVDGKDVSGHITGSNISGSATGTGSFGKILGDGSDISGISSYTVANSSNNRVLTSVNSTSGNAEANLTFDGSTLNLGANTNATSTLSINTSNSGSSALYFGDVASSTVAGMVYNHQLGRFVFSTEGATRVILENTSLTAFCAIRVENVGDENTPAFQLGTSNDGFYHDSDGIKFVVNNSTRFTFSDAGNFLPTGNVSGSSTSTGSFGRVETDSGSFDVLLSLIHI